MMDAETIRYCANGCTRINRDGHPEPIRATIGNLCRRCYDNLDQWLDEIPDRYARVPEYLLPTINLDPAPGAKTGKRAHSPAPVRLAALDLLDTRLARTMNGLAPDDERRGALGLLNSIANEIRDQRRLRRPQPHEIYVRGEADLIRNHLEWLTGVSHINELHREIKNLHRTLGYAIGQYPPRPVGYCTVPPEDSDPPEDCGGPLIPITSGVICLECKATWGHDRLRILGMTLGAPA